MNENLKNLYNTLVSNGYNPPAFDQFAKDMQDEKNLRGVYSTLQKEGYTPPAFDTFKSDMGIAPAPSSSSTKKQNTLVSPTAKPLGGGIASLIKNSGAAEAAERAAADAPSYRDPHAVSSWLANIRGQAAHGVRNFNERSANLLEHSKKNPLGRNTVASGFKYNRKSGDFEQTYITPYGTRHTNKAEADEVSRQWRDENDHSIEKQIGEAYREQERLESELEKLTNEVDRSGDKEFLNERYKQSAVAGDAGIALMGDFGVYENADYNRLNSAIRANKQRIKTLEAVRDKGGFWRGAIDTTLDPNTWLFGIPGLVDAATLYTTSKKLEKNGGDASKLTEAEKSMLDNVIANNNAQGEYGDELGFMYGAGALTANALPFVAEFVATGGFSGIANAGARYGSRLAEKAAAKGITNKAAQWLIKNTGVAAGDIASGVVMANTTGVARTASDILGRNMGEVTADGRGGYEFKGGKSLGKSVYEGEAANTLEYYTEKLGEHLQLGKWLSKGAEKLGLSKLSKAIGYVGSNRWLEKGGVQDYPSEVLEEEANIVLNSLLVGDNKFSDLWDAKTQADIWGGMAFSLGFMNAPKYANTGYQAAQYYRYKHKTDKSDAAAARQIGNEQWQELKNSIDNADNSQIADVVLGISTDENLSNDGKSAAMEYVGDLLRMRGYNMGMINSVKDDMSDEGAEEERVVDTSVGSSYSDGYKAADENEAAVIGAEYNTAEENALDMFDNDTLELLDNDPVYALAQMRRDGQYTDDELSAAVDYVNAKAARDGAEQRMADDLDSEIDTARGEVTQRINGDDFMIHGAQMKADNTDGAPKRVHIISGNVTTREDGSVDAAKSSQTIVVRDAATGKVEMVSPEYIRSVDEAIDPQEEYSNAEAAARAAYEEKKARIQATAEAEETEQPQTETPQAEVKGKEEQAEIQQVEDVQGSGRQIKPQAEGENLQTETQTGAEQAAAESPIVQQEEIPVEKDKKGNVVRTLYHKVPMQRTLEDLYDGSLDQEEIDRFVENLAADAKRRLFSVENEKKPEIGNNKQAYLEAKKRHEEKLADARAEVEYYDNLQKEVLRVTQRGGQQTGVSEDLGGEPLSLEELAARFASEYKVTPESLKGETGMSGKELKGFVGLVAREDNGGVSIERLGELLARSDEWAQLGGTPEMTQEARNMLIDAYMSGNPRSYVKQQRKRFAQKEAEHEMNEIENFAQAAFGMSAEEYLAYEEQALPAIINKYAGFDFDIYYAILQEQADARTNEAEANYNNSINGNTNEQQGESNGNGGSSSVLQTERTADEQGERTSDEPEAGGQGSVGDAGLQGVGTQGTMGEDAPEPLGEKTNNGDVSDSHGRNKKIEEAKAAALERRKADGIQQDDAGEAGGGAGEEAGNGEKKNVGGGQKNVGEHSVGRVSSTESTGGDSAGGSDINEEFVPIERQIIDPRTMSDEERQKRGDLLRNATEIDVTPNQIVSTKNKTARNAAEEWWDNHVGEAKWYETEVGEVEINRNSVESSLAHGYGQMKLDAITSLVDGFSNAVYLGTMPDSTRQNGVLNHYFAYPIKYNDKRCYVFCRALHDNNTNRLYVHEVFVEDKIEKGNTLQTAASQPHGGIALYRDILANVLISDGKVTEKENSVQTSIANAEAETDTDPSEAQKKAGNYKKGHLKIDGFDVTIENPKGSVRSGVDADGKQWEQEMHNTYGYILGTEGVDGDHIDVFLSDNPANGDVFVVDQVNKDGTFDEHKVMYGFASEEEARNAYLSNYEDGWTGLGAITRVSKKEFKKWVDSSHRKTKPFAEYKGIKKAEATDNAEASNSTRSAFDNLKKQASDRMLIFKEGDNYEILYEDAKKAAEILELPVQKKDGKEFVSFPVKDLDKNLPLLIREGVMVAITDELVNTKNQKAAETEAPGVTDSRQVGDQDAAPYTITPAQYITKKGKALDMHIVKFAGTLTIEQQRAAKELAKSEKGWYDREQGGFMMRSEESAKQLADTILNNEDAVSDAQPVSLADTRKIVETEQQVQPTKQSGNRLVTDERYAELRERMRKKLGGQMNIGIDPEILAIGTEMAVYHLEKGARKFTEYAKAMIADLGDAIRPYLKAFYNGARNLPEVEGGEIAADMTPYDVVQQFNVATFDKERSNLFTTISIVAAEQAHQKEAEQAKQEIINQRNTERRNEDEQTSASTEAIASQAEVVAGEAEMDADVETAVNISNTDEDDEVFRDGRGAYTPDEVSMENDPWSKMAGYNIRSKKERASFAERERRRMVAAVTELAERLGIADDVEIVTDLSGLQGRQRRAKGIYRKSSGKITIYIPNHINVADAVATFLHEAVAHKGLRNLFGKHFDEFLDKVYANSNSEIRSAIDALARKKKLSTRTATEEYLAGLAEKTDFEHLPYNGWLQRVKTFFIEMLSKIGIKALDTTTLTDNELRFILWRSYRYMQGKDKGIIAFVEDTAMKMKLGVGYSDKEGASGAAEVAGKTEVSAKNKKNSARSVFDNLKKQQAFDKMFLFKVGDNYEILYDDAKSASEILGLPLQEKDGKEFVSFPVKDLDKNLALLVRGGAYVAVDNNPVQELFRDSATEVRGENSEEELFRDGEEEVPDDTENADETDGGKKKSDTKALRDILMFGNLSLTERTTAAKLLYSNIQNWDKKRKADAIKAIGENIADLAKAMRLQRDFDKATVKRVHDLARVLMESGYLSDLKEQEIKRLLAAVKNSVGKNDIDASVQKVMDIMIDNMLRRGKAALSAIESVRGSKTDTRGVEVQGMLGVDGQTIVKAFKEAKKIVNPCAGKTEGENGENTAWGAAFESVYSRMDSKDQAVADEASLEYAGMQMAQQWYDDIAKSELEESEIRLELKEEHDKKSVEERRTDSYREFAASMEEAIRQNKIERAQAYFNLAGRLSDSLRGSVENALAFKEAEKQRIGEIHHAANSDMRGRSAKEHQMSSGTRKALNNLLGNYLFTPLATYMEMLRLFGAKSVNGEGYLFNRFGRGWIDARQKEIRGVRGKLELLDAKAKEVFGGKVKTWGDLIRAVGKLPKGKVSFFNGGEMQETELPQGNLMYIYMANKMLDGKMKLRKMGISEEDVAQIETAIDPRLKEIADWLQKEFLVNSRNEYNETHKRMFGASMAAIENYFPLRILNNALDVKADELDRPEVTDGISTVTGSIIKRRRNSKPLDILNADALHVILGHVSQMEHWNAYAEFNRDLNTLRSYRRFRNQVQNMETIYGNGKNLWNKFNDVCQMAAGVYKPKGDEAEKAALAVAQGVTAAAVSFRLYTALKQFASLPAYIPYTSADYLAKAMMRPDKSWEWCMENLPIFEERWKSRVSGDPRLVKSFLTTADWRRNLAANCARAGMAPNAFIDALTCSIGAYAVYNTRKKQYLKDGYSEEQAERRAIQDAEMVYNETQQSGEDAFTSTMQRDRTWWKSLFTIFRNASMSYQRQLHGALRDLGNVMSGGVDERVAFVTKQLLREKGIHPNENGEWGEADYKREEAIAKRKVRRQFVKDGLSVATFGYIMQLAWNISGYLPYLLFGDDDETKDEFWDDIWTHTFGGWLEGFTGGDVMSLAIGMLLNGEYDSWKLKKEMPVTSATYDAIGHLLKGDFGAFATNVTNLLIQVSAGVNPQSLTDGALAILDACGGDVSLANEAMLCATRILSVPQSQIDELYFDEVGIRGEEASKYTPAQLAERYALYKVKRGHFFAPWSWDDEELIEKQEEKANTSIKERLGHAEFTGVTEAYERYEKVAKEIGEQVNALKKAERDGSIKQDEGKKRMDAIKQDRNFNTYALFTNLDKVLEAMSKRYMAAKSPEEAAMYAEAIEMYRLAMLDALSADNYAELIEAISRAREINVRTQEEWRNKYKK